MKHTLVLLALTAVSIHAIAKSQNPHSRIRLHSNESVQIFKALQSTGVVDESPMLGATTLAAHSVECEMPVGLDGLINCRVTTANSSLNMPTAEAANVMPILQVYSQKYHSHAGRTQIYKANNVVCVQVIVPGATPTCSFVALTH